MKFVQFVFEIILVYVVVLIHWFRNSLFDNGRINCWLLLWF